MQHKRNLLLGILIAPWIVPLGIYMSLILFYFEKPLSVVNSATLLFLVIIFGVSFTYIVTLLLVVPMLIWLKTKNELSAIRLCIWCAVLGPITMFIYATFLNGLSSTVNKVHLAEGLLCLAFGLITGAALCIISGIRLRVHRD